MVISNCKVSEIKMVWNTMVCNWRETFPCLMLSQEAAIPVESKSHPVSVLIQYAHANHFISLSALSPLQAELSSSNEHPQDWNTWPSLQGQLPFSRQGQSYYTCVAQLAFCCSDPFCAINVGSAILSDKEATFRETDMKNDPGRNGIFLTKRYINVRTY